jgi:hypothetical protein
MFPVAVLNIARWKDQLIYATFGDGWCTCLAFPLDKVLLDLGLGRHGDVRNELA